MTQGSTITLLDGQLQVPKNPIIHYIEGDGIGIDITPVMIKVVDNAVKKAYAGSRNICWSGQKYWLDKRHSTPPANGSQMRH